ncbi:MAG TPA: hypothetical protein VHM88_23310 [Candidatus Acidoferrales bacterium]|nr:hypothetical protein [Candidatus Acidoferrales bacterium]
MVRASSFLLGTMIETLKTFWRWLTTTRYTRTLEAEVERLRAENRALLNSLLGTAGFPPLAEPEAKTQPPIPRVRRRSWHQIAALRELAAAAKSATPESRAPGQARPNDAPSRGPFH